MRDTEEIYNDIVQVLEDAKRPHIKMYYLGIKSGGRPARVAIRKLKALSQEYARVSVIEQKAMNK